MRMTKWTNFFPVMKIVNTKMDEPLKQCSSLKLAPLATAKKRLSALLPNSDDWAGPVAQVMMDALKISYGAYRFDYEQMGVDGVLYGHHGAIPVESIPALIKLASVHRETYWLAKLICADLLRGTDQLPTAVRDLGYWFLTNEGAQPRKRSQAGRKLPSAKTFLRDQAIYLTLVSLKNAYELRPTKNRAGTSSNMSGAEYVAQAMRELHQKDSNLYPAAINVREIEKVWETRKRFEDMCSLVAEELAHLIENEI